MHLSPVNRRACPALSVGDTVADGASDHRVDLRGRGPQGLGVHDHRSAFEVTVDEDPAPAVANSSSVWPCPPPAGTVRIPVLVP